MQPIETCPKKAGTEYLLRVKSRAGIPGCYLVGHWMPGGHCIEDHPAIDDGWYFWNGCMFDRAAEPTHWMPLGEMSIEELISVNRTRVERWHSLDGWSALEWAGAMAGETGEACNAAKKLKRVEAEIANNDGRTFGVDIPKDQLVPMYRHSIGLEVADAIIYGLLLCMRVDVDIVACIREVFNKKSEEYGFPERL